MLKHVHARIRARTNRLRFIKHRISTRKPSAVPIDIPLVRQVPCNFCGGMKFSPVFRVESAHKEQFQIVRCLRCRLVQVNPQPNAAAVKPYYSKNYFLKRTRRGYSNYYSKDMQNEIQRVYQKNLLDLDFFSYEKEIFAHAKETFEKEISTNAKEGKRPRALDAGCAAGYFIEFLQERGWDAEGIELSDFSALEGRKKGLKIQTGDFLSSGRLQPKSYDLITLWASLEHMHDPFGVFLQSAKMLKANGRFILSTCRYGFLARIQKEKWRFMNVPEHLYFFTVKQLEAAAQKAGFDLVRSVTYGSGLTKKENMGWVYKGAKGILDWLVKVFSQGDMTALHFQKQKEGFLL